MTDLTNTTTGNSYKDALLKHGESPKALRWNSYESAAQRYRQLVSDIDFENKTILDAGCGMGDLLPFIYAKADKFSYLGMDIEPEFIEIAKKRYSGHNFQVGNPFSDQMSQAFDVIISSGVMNNNSSDWMTKRKLMISEMFNKANQVFAFNMAGSAGEATEGKDIGYANITEVFEFCLNLTPKIILRNHYSTKDFTIVMFK